MATPVDCSESDAVEKDDEKHSCDSEVPSQKMVTEMSDDNVCQEHKDGDAIPCTSNTEFCSKIGNSNADKPADNSLKTDAGESQNEELSESSAPEPVKEQAAECESSYSNSEDGLSKSGKEAEIVKPQAEQCTDEEGNENSTPSAQVSSDVKPNETSSPNKTVASSSDDNAPSNQSQEKEACVTNSLANNDPDESKRNEILENTTISPTLRRDASGDDDVFEEGVAKTDNKSLGERSSDAKQSYASGSEISVSVSSSIDEKPAGEERPVREMLVRRRRTESTETNSDKPVLETLTFSTSKIDENGKEEKSQAVQGADTCVCIMCDRSYPADNKEDVLAHLVLIHKFVIADVNYIASLPAYLRYWKQRLREKPVAEFCSKIVTNTGTKDTEPREEFYLLCDALPEDKEMREHLQRKKLESVLAQQQREREETKFCRQCLFCKQTYCGNRAVLFDHLLRDHTFHMGQPDNLGCHCSYLVSDVFTDELFDLIQSKLDNQLCLFCEKSFKDKASLREHMRKKQHRKINPKNKEYDRFYIINYMEMGKNWETLQSEDNRLVKTTEKTSDEEEEWAGWDEEGETKVVCLFCDSSCAVQTDLQNHMKEKHSFDLQGVNNKLQLNFYQKVKLINYIRRQVYHNTCYHCQGTFSDKTALLDHMTDLTDHIKKVPDAGVWDQPQYFFPTYEDDSLLCHLDDDDDGAAGDALGVTVIAEDIPVTDTILKDQKLRRDLLKS